MERRCEELPRCKCGGVLWSCTEVDFNACNRCLDRMAERERERREFDYYHSEGRA